MLDPDGNPNTDDAPQVVNNSWTMSTPGCNLDFEPDLQALRAAGILPVFAAGNYGSASNTSRSPANNPSAFPVGALNSNNTIYSLSSRGPTSCTGSSGPYPRIVAPGVNINSTDRFGLYFASSGTSLAAPHIAGGLALLLSAFPNLSPAEQENVLVNSAADLGVAGPDDIYGYGRLNLLAAFNLLSNSATVTPTSINTATNTALPTNTFTSTSAPPTNTFTATALPTFTFTSTPVPPTSTYTFTPTNTFTNTPVPPTSTFTKTATFTPTNTATATNTPLPLTSTFTTTPTPTYTSTFTPTNTALPANTFTNTPVPPTSTFTKTATPTNTFTFTPTSTALPTNTFTKTAAPTNTFTLTPTNTVTATKTSTPAPANTPTATATRSSSQQSKAVTPVSLVTQSGSTSGSLASLSLLEQTGTDNNPAAYVSFQTPGSVYAGYQSFVLPSDATPSLISTMLLQVNFNGPDPSTQTWNFSIYDWGSQMWINLGDTVGTNANQWTTLTFRVKNISRFISPGREVRIRLQSSNSSGDARLDYEAIHITYRPVAVASLDTVPGVPAVRPGIASVR